jgi:hypothetical protein
MPESIVPDDKLTRTAREYLSRVSSVAPSQAVLDDTVRRALSRRARLSVGGILGTVAVALATVGAVVVALAFHSAPAGGAPAGPSYAPVATSPSTAAPTSAPASASPSASAVVTPPLTTVPAAVNVCQANPSPATASDVVVEQPSPFAQVTSPLVVSGRINAYEATFRLAIKDASGHDIAAQAGHSAQGQTLSAFSERVPFSVTAPTPACLWVFQYSARDGSAQKIAQVPVTLEP